MKSWREMAKKQFDAGRRTEREREIEAVEMVYDCYRKIPSKFDNALI